ncbi:hypothetical protein QBC39DRAFT_109507 [Podospora conica]|nr:hypothetical protein QBC39DRAFT_109507 [Schizothecium conicum]
MDPAVALVGYGAASVSGQAVPVTSSANHSTLCTGQSSVTMPAMILSRHQSCKQSLPRLLQRQPVFPVPFSPPRRFFHHIPPATLPRTFLFSNRHASSLLVAQRSPPVHRRPLSTTPAAKMASDDDYLAFLNKANQDPSEGRATTAASDSKSPFKTTSAGVEVPKVLQALAQREDLVYVSDADEPFVPVALRYEGEGKGGGLPDEEEFAKLIGHAKPQEAEIEILDPVDWDSQGQYNEVVDAVREAGRGNDVRVYRVVRDGVRVEYWVVTWTEGGAMVGVKALGVES